MLTRLSLTIVALAASAGSAQVIYEPVRTQYGGENPYYYAGNNPAIHEASLFPSAPGAHWGRVPGYAFVSPRRQVVERNYRVFTDALGTVNARPYGLTPDQVQNEANARLPRYFTKRDLLTAAQLDGPVRRERFVVAPDATAEHVSNGSIPRGTMSIRPLTPGLHNRYPIFSFPREMMDRKAGQISIKPSPAKA